jgi:hypothetical protein
MKTRRFQVKYLAINELVAIVLAILRHKYRKITKPEACLIQGFPADFTLPDARARWMKLIGNSVAVPVVDAICKAIVDTGVFQNSESFRKE